MVTSLTFLYLCSQTLDLKPVLCVIRSNMTARYQCDDMALAVSRGRARQKNLDRKRADKPTSTTEMHESTKHALGQTLNKWTNKTPKCRTTSNISERNTGYCNPCRRIFDDLGNYVSPLSTNDSGLFYSHWDGRYLTKSAANGCPLCLLIYRALGTQLMGLTCGEVIPAYYDFAEYGVDSGAYALRFSYYVAQQRADMVWPVQLGPVIITV